jgi:hypothetical protein
MMKNVILGLLLALAIPAAFSGCEKADYKHPAAR